MSRPRAVRQKTTTHEHNKKKTVKETKALSLNGAFIYTGIIDIYMQSIIKKIVCNH